MKKRQKAQREISGCDLAKFRVNIYFPSLGLSVVAWWIHRLMSSNTHCCYSKTPVPPHVYGGMTCTVADCYTIQTKNEILMLWAWEYTVPATHIYTHIQARTNRQTHVSRKCVPLLKGRLPAQLIPTYFTLFPILWECVLVCVYALACVCVSLVSIITCPLWLHNMLNLTYVSPTLPCTDTHTHTQFVLVWCLYPC